MGRAARTKHERREVARWAQAAELAERADQAADHVIAHCLARLSGARARSTSTPCSRCGPGRTPGGAYRHGPAPNGPQRTVRRPYKSAGVSAQPSGPSQRYHSATHGEETGRHVAPHLRKPHHYWTGPLTDPEQRQLVLRCLAPISAGSELPVTTVDRPAS
ncbi:MAG: hypothetical protein ACLP7F_05625 [Acidimicrobiales bacterium]